MVEKEKDPTGAASSNDGMKPEECEPIEETDSTKNRNYHIIGLLPSPLNLYRGIKPLSLGLSFFNEVNPVRMSMNEGMHRMLSLLTSFGSLIIFFQTEVNTYSSTSELQKLGTSFKKRLQLRVFDEDESDEDIYTDNTHDEDDVYDDGLLMKILNYQYNSKEDCEKLIRRQKTCDVELTQDKQEIWEIIKRRRIKFDEENGKNLPISDVVRRKTIVKSLCTECTPPATSIFVYPLTFETFIEKSVHGPPLLPDEKYQLEIVRLASFSQWPIHSAARPVLLAAAGFYASGWMDEVVCFCCHGKITNWQPGWLPMDAHQRFYPDCDFVCGHCEDNVPFDPPPRQMDEFNEKMNGMLQKLRSATPGSNRDVLFIPQDNNVPDLLHSIEHNLVISNQAEPSTSPTVLSSQARETTLSQSRQRPSPNSVTGATLRYYTHTFDEDGKAKSIPQQLNVKETSSVNNPEGQDMKSEAARLRTFSSWTKSSILTSEELAKAGFYFIGSLDRTKCAFCSGILRNWVKGDRAMIEHRRHFSTCPFVLNLDVGNIPIKRDHENLNVSQPESLAIVQQSLGRSASSVLSRGTGSQSSVDPRIGRILETPKHPEYLQPSARMETFHNWPMTNSQSPMALVECGLYYSGRADNVRCFFCDGGLRNWEPTDDPWIEHCRWFPQCGFLHQRKGTDFVKNVLDQYSDQASAMNEYLVSGGLDIPPCDSSAAQQNEDIFPYMNNDRASDAAVELDHSEHSNVVFRVQAREIRARLDRAIVRRVLDMGYNIALVKYVLCKQLRETGDDFNSAQQLLEALFELEPLVMQKGVSYFEQRVEEELDDRPKQTKKNTGSTANENSKTGGGSSEDSNRSVQAGDLLNHGKVSKEKAETTVVKDVHKDDENDEIRKLKEELMCKICMDNKADIVFLPCGHLVSCRGCAPAMKKCPICRANIRGTVRTFMS
ncbi:baculoviral IAP repeat-containing protein 3-like [Tubulanus polymorphus]|uniref:baculoviral IAP repeat-containing protein 3-like n=1 Tax=Tubulanus polymorphus TaxID=672921 RepID=UPI003DA29DDD